MNIYVQICVLHLYIFAPSHVTQARGLMFNKDYLLLYLCVILSNFLTDNFTFGQLFT